MGLSAGVAPRRGRCADDPGLESPGYRQDITLRWEASSRKSPQMSFGDCLMLLAVATVPLRLLEARKAFIRQRTAQTPA